MGEEVWLDGKARLITELKLLFTHVGSKSGTFDIRIRFRPIRPNQSPGKPFYDSGVLSKQSIHPGSNTFVFKLPKIKVPDHFVWTMRIYNRKGAEGEFGPMYYDPPTVGRSNNMF